MMKRNITINPNHMFSGALAFLSNMYPCTITIDVLGQPFTFTSAEAAFQAGKCLDLTDVRLFTNVANGAAAKKLGRRIRLRKDWDTYRLAWMEQVLICKFNQNPILLQKLLDTYPTPLAETNTWGDTFWGVCNGQGENHLGQILMKIREENRPLTQSGSTLDIL